MGLVNRKEFRDIMALLCSLCRWRHGKITYPRSLQHFLKRHAQTTVRKDEALEFTYPVTAVSTFQNA